LLLFLFHVNLVCAPRMLIVALSPLLIHKNDLLDDLDGMAPTPSPADLPSLGREGGLVADVDAVTVLAQHIKTLRLRIFLD